MNDALSQRADRHRRRRGWPMKDRDILQAATVSLIVEGTLVIGIVALWLMVWGGI